MRFLKKLRRRNAVLPGGYVVRKEDPLTLRDSEPEPDIAVVKGGAADFRLAHPTTAELVVEVSVTSPALDREGAALYAEAGVGEYWIILAREKRVEVYRRPEGGVFREKTEARSGEMLTCASIPAIAIRLAELFQ